MKKFLITVFFITSISIIYVFQYTKLVEYSYQLNSHQKYTSFLVDHNRELRYNIARLENPARLEQAMAARQAADISMPALWHNIMIEEGIPAPKEVIVPSRPFSNMGALMVGMFSLDNEAVAKESDKKNIFGEMIHL